MAKLFLSIIFLMFSLQAKASYESINDCTAKKWQSSAQWWKLRDSSTDIEDRFIAVSPVIDIEVRRKALASVTKWSKINGYLPCSSEVCGLVANSKSGGIVISIDDAWLIVDDSYKVKESIVLHNGCATKRVGITRRSN